MQLHDLTASAQTHIWHLLVGHAWYDRFCAKQWRYHAMLVWHNCQTVCCSSLIWVRWVRCCTMQQVCRTAYMECFMVSTSCWHVKCSLPLLVVHFSHLSWLPHSCLLEFSPEQANLSWACSPQALHLMCVVLIKVNIESIYTIKLPSYPRDYMAYFLQINDLVAEKVAADRRISSSAVWIRCVKWCDVNRNRVLHQLSRRSGTSKQRGSATFL